MLLWRFLRCCWGGPGAGLILGILYVYAIAWIPSIYVIVFATAAFGFLLGRSVNKAVQVGRVRNVPLAYAVGFGTGLFGLYVAWAWDATAKFGGQLVLWQPAWLWEYICLFYEEGFWRLSEDDKDNVKGIALGLIWAVEAFLIVGLAAWQAGLSAGRPFCESCGEWMEETREFKRAAPGRQ